MEQFHLNTSRENFYNITASVRESVRKSGLQDGLCLVYCPHTTAGITINENTDPDVVSDLLLGLAKAFPDQPEFRHMEGNSAAHLKASCVGSSVLVPVEKGALCLGTWQGIYFCEFDGPRHRTYSVKML